MAFMRKDDSSTSSSSSSGQMTIGYISVTLIIIFFNSHSNITCRSEVTLASSKGDELGTGIYLGEGWCFSSSLMWKVYCSIVNFILQEEILRQRGKCMQGSY